MVRIDRFGGQNRPRLVDFTHPRSTLTIESVEIDSPQPLNLGYRELTSGDKEYEVMSEPKLSVQVMFRLTAADCRALNEQARRERRSRSNLVRCLVLQALSAQALDKVVRAVDGER